VAIVANPAPQGQVFDQWLSSPSVNIVNPLLPSTSLTMPALNAMVIATYRTNPSTPTFPSGRDQRIRQWQLSGGHERGDRGEPGSTGPGVRSVAVLAVRHIANPLLPSTSLIMPALNAMVIATYRTNPSTPTVLTPDDLFAPFVNKVNPSEKLMGNHLKSAPSERAKSHCLQHAGRKNPAS